jgi:hypothetical protein
MHELAYFHVEPPGAATTVLPTSDDETDDGEVECAGLEDGREA